MPRGRGYDETLSVTNHGPTEATDVVVTILLPQGSSAFVPVPLELDIATLLFSQCPPFAYGYLSHLAADVYSHNHFVPVQLVTSFEARTLRHAAGYESLAAEHAP